MKKVTLETWHKSADTVAPSFDCYYTEIRSTQPKAAAKAPKAASRKK